MDMSERGGGEPSGAITLLPVTGLPEVHPGDDLAALLLAALDGALLQLQPGDVLALAQKIVSKAEGRMVTLADVTPARKRNGSPPR